MEILQGKVSDLRHGATLVDNTVTDGQRNGGITTIHTALFRLQNQQVYMQAGAPIAVSTGDDVVVAGRRRNGMLLGLAHRNLTTGVEGSEGWALRLLVCALLLAIGTSMLTQGFATPRAGVPLLFMLAWVGVIAWQAWRSVQVLRAVRSLRALPTTPQFH